jgi:hypothetical protein
VVTPNSNLPQQAAIHNLNQRCPTYELNAFLPDHEDPSTLNTLILALKISRYNKHQVPAKPDYLHKHFIMYVSHQQQEVGFNRNSRYYVLTQSRSLLQVYKATGITTVKYMSHQIFSTNMYKWKNQNVHNVHFLL